MNQNAEDRVESVVRRELLGDRGTPFKERFG
jgi:hypothetical protein